MTTETTPDKKSNRVQLSDVIKCKLSTSRLRVKLTDNGLNVDVGKCLDEFVDELGEDKSVFRKGAESYAQLSEECRGRAIANLPGALSDEQRSKLSPEQAQFADCVELLRENDDAKLAQADQVSLLATAKSLVKSQLVRNSDGATVTFTATMNYVLTTLAVQGCKQLAIETKRTLRPYHMVEKEIESTDIWPLIRDLKCVQDVRDDRAKFLSEQSRLSQEKKKKKDKTQPPDANAPKPEKKKKAKEPKQPWSDFVHHTSLIFKQEAKRLEFEMSHDVKNFGARLLFELCDSYVQKLRVLVTFSGAKTIKPQTIDCVTDLSLVACGVDGSELHEYVAHRLALYKEHKLAKKEASQ